MKVLPLLLAVLLPLCSGRGAWASGVWEAGAEAQGRFFFKTYGPEQGLVEPALATVAQDADGFLWIASENGLIRYDGNQFQKWTTADGLPSSFINNILPLAEGGLWVGTNKGVVRFQEGRSTPLLHEGKPLVVGGALMQLDGQGALWLLAEDGLYRQRGPAAMERLPLGFLGAPKALALRAATGSVFLALSGGLWERKQDGQLVSLAGAKGLPAQPVEALAVDGTGRLWVVGTHSLHYQDAGESGFHEVSSWLPAGPFQGCIIRPYPDGSVAIPTNAGLVRLRGDVHELLDSSLGLPCKWTVSSLMDREGNLWVVGPRVYRLLGRGYLRGFTSQDGLPSDLVWSPYRDRLGRLWVGTGEGLARLGPRGWFKVPGTDGLSVTSLVLDDQDRLWIGSNNQVLYCLEPGAKAASDKAFRRLSWQVSRPGQVRPTRSTSLLLDGDGSLWLADPSHGIYRIDLRAGSLRPEFLPRAVGLPGMAMRTLAADAAHRICAATSSGLLLRDTQGWRRWTRAEGLRDDGLLEIRPLPDGSCWVIYQEALGMDRVTCTGAALQVLEHRDGSHGIASDRVYSVGLDPRGGLWVGTDRGVDRLRASGALHIGLGGGMAGEDCSGSGMLSEPNGDLWVGTSTGLAHILAAREPGPYKPMKVFIQQILRGKTLLTPPFGERPPLSHRDRTLEFRFACPTFVNERAVLYQVRLLGLEEDWRITEVPQARYAALPAGRYQFEVRAAYPGQPFGPATTYRLEVLGPWWGSGWFLGLTILGGAGLVTAFLYGRLHTLGRQKRRLASLVDRRTADLQKANLALEQANLALKAQSLADPLTGLHNRRFLSMVVDDDLAAVARAYRASPSQPLANQDLVFFMVDLDHFKQVNDLHGHGVGDRALELTAAALRKAARENDAVIRWGGEEFLVMARDSSRAEAHLLAGRICSLVAEQELTLDIGETLKWTCSVGFAALPFQPEDPGWMGWERVVEIADACLYLAKRAGRNGWVGAQGGPGLRRAEHGARVPWELLELREEGVIELCSSRPEAMWRGPRTGDVFV